MTMDAGRVNGRFSRTKRGRTMGRNHPRSTIRYLLIATVLLLFSVAAIAQDPVTTNPAKYTMILDPARVRVLEYRDRAGEKTAIHSHPDSVIYALAPFKRKLTVNGGQEVVVEMKAGDV